MVHPPSVKREGSHLRSLSLRARVSITRTLAWMLDSLVRVSRRAAYDHYASVLAEARTSAGAGRISPGAITLPPKGEPRSPSLWATAPADAGLPAEECTRLTAG